MTRILEDIRIPMDRIGVINDDNREELDQLFLKLLQEIMKPAAYKWLNDKIALIQAEPGSAQLNQTFAQVPRFATKKLVKLRLKENVRLAELMLGNATNLAEWIPLTPKFTIENWTEETLCRVWILMQIPVRPKDIYIEKINGLFTAAELNEQVALYTALPFLEYHLNWISRCEEGIRSNIGPILEAIMYYNPYPAAVLCVSAWNQMILKAFFTDKDINKVIGAKQLLNMQLSDSLTDYVKERESAGRTVNPEIYPLITKYNKNYVLQ